MMTSRHKGTRIGTGAFIKFVKHSNYC